MGLLDWMKSSAPARSKSDDQGGASQSLNIYFYRADGRYPPAWRAETAEQFVEMVPKIREHVDNKLEVRITNTDDHLLFHATQKGIEWDGIQLKSMLDHERRGAVLEAEPKPSRTHSIFSDYPDRVLKTEADVKKDDALLEMMIVVNEIANDPDTNWRRYKGDFEKAVNDMREAFEAKVPDVSEREPEKTRDGKVFWMSDIYGNDNAKSWAWVLERTASGRFDAGITVFAHDVGFEEWKTAEGHESKSAAMTVANESFERWRQASAPDMKISPAHVQQEIKDVYGLNEKENKASARERNHEWDR